MELNEKDKELIAKIDERLKHYKLITDNEQQAHHNWQKQIELNKKPKPLNIAPVEWKVGEWAWNSYTKDFLGTIVSIRKGSDYEVELDNQDGKTANFYKLDLLVKPTKEEIEQHLVNIAKKKYPIGTKVKCLHDCQDLTIGTDFTAHLEFDGEALRYTKEGFGVTAIWCEHETNKWAEPITEQKERWKPNSGEEYYYINEVFTIQPTINSHFMLDSPRIEAGNCFKTQEEAERAAQAIRETLKNL